MRTGTWVAVAVAPLLLLVLLLARPAIDGAWENHPAHFWLVLLTAAMSAALGYATSVAASRRGDWRVFLVSLAFLATAGFLGLHALATPGVLLPTPNAGFVLATPVGLALGSVLAAFSTVDVSSGAGGRAMRFGRLLRVALLSAMALVGAARCGFHPATHVVPELRLHIASILSRDRALCVSAAPISSSGDTGRH